MRTLSLQELTAVAGATLCAKRVKKHTCVKKLPKPVKTCTVKPPCDTTPTPPPVDPVDPGIGEG